jgi:hypothetical protein
LKKQTNGALFNVVNVIISGGPSDQQPPPTTTTTSPTRAQAQIRGVLVWRHKQASEQKKKSDGTPETGTDGKPVYEPVNKWVCFGGGEETKELPSGLGALAIAGSAGQTLWAKWRGMRVDQEFLCKDPQNPSVAPTGLTRVHYFDAPPASNSTPSSPPPSMPPTKSPGT